MKKLRKTDFNIPPILEQCMKLLKKFGTCELHDARKFRVLYQDSKIQIFGYLEDNSDDIYLVTVELKVRDENLARISKSRNIDPDFGMSRQFEHVDMKTTPVLQYRFRENPSGLLYIRDYVRYGRWMNHVKKIAEYADKIEDMYEKLDGEDIDDSSFFPDLPDPMD